MKYCFLSIIFILLLSVGIVNATEFTSTSYKVLDPVIDVAAGPRAATTSYVLLTAVGQPAIGRSTSATFGLLSGFLYFFEPVVPPAGPTCGDNTCNGSETCSSCSADCGVCVPPGGGLLEPPITYFPPLSPFFPPLIPPFIPPVFPLPLPVIPPGCVPGEKGISRADLNCDGRVNLVDFSVFTYYLPRPIAISQFADISKDETVDLVDLSVMFSEWTEKLVAFANGDDLEKVSKKEEKVSGLDNLKEIFAKGKGILERAGEELSREKYESVAVTGIISGQEPLRASARGVWPAVIFGVLALAAIVILAARLKLKKKIL